MSFREENRIKRNLKRKEENQKNGFRNLFALFYPIQSIIMHPNDFAVNGTTMRFGIKNEYSYNLVGSAFFAVST